MEIISGEMDTASSSGPAGGSGAESGIDPGPWAGRIMPVIIGVAILAAVLLPSLLLGDPLQARALSIAAVCLVLWLSEVVPPFVPTILLWSTVPLLLAPVAKGFTLRDVLGWSADPVMPLFFGGFALSVAASKYGLDHSLAAIAITLSRGRRVRLLVLTALATAFLSMWMSNIAAAAMMIVAIRPLFAHLPPSNALRRGMLLAIAFGADFGGIATPIGSGPNAIAISAVSRTHPVTFVEWMAFGTPLALLLIASAIGLLLWRLPLREDIRLAAPRADGVSRKGRGVIVIALFTITLWLTEPLHGAPSPVVALAGTALLFMTRLLDGDDLRGIDWGTLLLIAGGLGLGRLLESAGLLATAASAIPWNEIPTFIMLFGLCLASAFLSALMSNTATATMLIPLAGTISSEPSTLILVAIAASLGIPFVISTPPNAMVYGEGGVPSRDLLVPGMIIMVSGCLVIALTGPFVLALMGIP